MSGEKEEKPLQVPMYVDGDSISEEDDKSVVKRATWSSQLDFIMAGIGGAVGLGNIWRFPYLCYRNGGGAFMIPYFISFLLMSLPMYLLETSLGQYTSQGCIGAWNLVPAFSGIGWCTAIILFYINVYYIVVIAWALYYLYRSFAAQVPWSTCDNPWNTDRCFVTGMNMTRTLLNCTDNGTNTTGGSNCTTSVSQDTRVDSVVEFWEKMVLHQSPGIDTPGKLVPSLTITLLIAWILVYFCLFKGVKWTGKIVYFTALFPYVLLTVLFFRGVTLDGAGNGILFYLKPDFSRLSDGQVWIDAATQSLYSCGAGQGFMLSLAGYNKFHAKTLRNGLIIICVNYFTSMYGGFCVFAVLGFMAKELGQPIKNVVSSGPGLVFMAYPKAITQLPLSSMWAALFFIFILFVGLDSQFAAVEGLVAPIMDLFPRTLYKSGNRMMFLAAYCIISFLCGLTMVTEGGVYVFRLVDFYGVSGLTLLITVFFEAVTISWAFGADRFYDVIELMIGRRINPWLKICWKYLGPIAFVAVFLFQLFTFRPLQYDADYQYPAWATGLGFIMILSSTLCIPAFLVYRFLVTKGPLTQRWYQIKTPILKKHQIHPSWHGSDYRWQLTGYDDYDVNKDMVTGL